jgi:hypothetical protein
MAQFIFTYVGGSQPATPEEGKAHMAKYMAWMGTLDAVTPQQPLKNTTTLGTKEIVPMMGYSIINAADIEAAKSIAASCPFLDMENSGMQVSELASFG